MIVEKKPNNSTIKAKPKSKVAETIKANEYQTLSSRLNSYDEATDENDSPLHIEKHSKSDWKQYIVMNEILGKPKAKR